MFVQLIKKFWQGVKNFCKRYDKIIMGAILGSFLTMIVGIYVNYEIQKEITERSHKFEIHKRDLDMRKTIFVNIHDLVKQQMFRLDRFIWAYPAERVSYEKLNKYWGEYVDSLSNWDIEYHKYRALLEIYYSPSLAKKFDELRDKLHTARLEVRRYWEKCAIKPCTWEERKITLGPIENPIKEEKIKLCIQKGIFKNIKNDTIEAYIKCVVAEARNSVTEFSKMLVKAHKGAQQKRGGNKRNYKKLANFSMNEALSHSYAAISTFNYSKSEVVNWSTGNPLLV